jgi:DNA-directed RNA polymerase subunit omega
MARITTEDCEDLVDGRFELVAVAAERTKQLIAGIHPVIEAKDDKFPVVALRELKFMDIEFLKNSIITRLQKHHEETLAIEETEHTSFESEIADLHIDNSDFSPEEEGFFFDDVSPEEE